MVQPGSTDHRCSMMLCDAQWWQLPLHGPDTLVQHSRTRMQRLPPAQECAHASLLPVPPAQELGEYVYLAFLARRDRAWAAACWRTCWRGATRCVLAASSDSARRLYLRHGFCQVAARHWSHPEFEGSAQLYWMVRGAVGQEVREGLLGAGAS